MKTQNVVENVDFLEAVDKTIESQNVENVVNDKQNDPVIQVWSGKTSWMLTINGQHKRLELGLIYDGSALGLSDRYAFRLFYDKIDRGSSGIFRLARLVFYVDDIYLVTVYLGNYGIRLSYLEGILQMAEGSELFRRRLERGV